MKNSITNIFQLYICGRFTASEREREREKKYTEQNLIQLKSSQANWINFCWAQNVCVAAGSMRQMAFVCCSNTWFIYTSDGRKIKRNSMELNGKRAIDSFIVRSFTTRCQQTHWFDLHTKICIDKFRKTTFIFSLSLIWHRTFIDTLSLIASKRTAAFMNRLNHTVTSEKSMSCFNNVSKVN